MNSTGGAKKDSAVNGENDLPSKSLLPLIWNMVSPYKKWLLYIFCAMLVETAMSLAAPWPLKIIIDNVVNHHPLKGVFAWLNSLLPGGTEKQLTVIVAISVIIIATVGALATYINDYFTESIAQYVSNNLRGRIYHHLQRLSLEYYDTHQIGKLLSTLTTDVSTIQDFASSSLMNIIVDLLTIFGMLGIMFYLNAGFTLVAIGVTPFLLFFVSRFRKIIKKATRAVRQDQSTMLAILQQGLESIRSVNAFGRQDLEEERLKKISLQTVGAALKARRIKSVLNPMIALTIAFCTAVVLWRGSDLVLNRAMTVGSLTVFLWYMNKFFSPVQDLAKMINTIAQATVALERVQAILGTHIMVAEKPGARAPERLIGNISFRHVYFSYNPAAPVLKDLNLEISSGQRIGICGPTGCGKSTVASLIARFYDPNAGQVCIDGTNIMDFTLDGLRSQIGFVLQDTVLFYGSVRENIAYGRPEATEAEIIAAAKLSNAHEFISKMPMGYDTLVGERGVTLSGGQRQRLGIARAVVRNAPILVLDEPTASLDAEAERTVMDALQNLMKGRTVITIAHRLSTISNADKIIVLQEGRVAEEGNHEQLMKKEGIYAALFNIQAAIRYQEPIIV